MKRENEAIGLGTSDSAALTAFHVRLGLYEAKKPYRGAPFPR
jgi:hypothetical protein